MLYETARRRNVRWISSSGWLSVSRNTGLVCGTAQWEVVDAFLAASRQGDFDALISVLHPDVVLRADGGLTGLSREVRGAETVAGQALMWSQVEVTMRRALINGAAGIVSMREGRPFSVGAFTVAGGKIVELDILADPERLQRLDLTVLIN
jgi:hypothetical protein